MIIFFDGLITGLVLQLAIGPLFFFIFGITIQSNFLNAISGILAVTLVDFIFITLSILGVGKIIDNSKYKTLLKYLSTFVLIIFGLIFIIKTFTYNLNTQKNSFLNITPINSFVSCFILTISSPLSIIFWSSIFTSKALQKGYSKNDLILFGFGAGIMTFIFLTFTMFILYKVGIYIPKTVIQYLNIFVGIIIIIYAILQFIKSKKELRLPER